MKIFALVKIAKVKETDLDRLQPLRQYEMLELIMKSVLVDATQKTKVYIMIVTRQIWYMRMAKARRFHIQYMKIQIQFQLHF